jgi:hypothetical protein
MSEDDPMTDETAPQTEDQPAPQPAPARVRVNTQTAMTRFVWSMLKPFILVGGGAFLLIYLLRLAGV